MKEYKIHFSIFNLLSESQSEVVKLQTIFKAISASIATTAWYASGDRAALYTAIAGIAVDTFLACFYFEEKK